MKLPMRLEYPKSDEFEYEARLIRLNLDKEMENDMANRKAFLIK